MFLLEYYKPYMNQYDTSVCCFCGYWVLSVRDMSPVDYECVYFEDGEDGECVEKHNRTHSIECNNEPLQKECDPPNCS